MKQQVVGLGGQGGKQDLILNFYLFSRLKN
jgi:hypothetical protein